MNAVRKLITGFLIIGFTGCNADVSLLKDPSVASPSVASPTAPTVVQVTPDKVSSVIETPVVVSTLPVVVPSTTPSSTPSTTPSSCPDINGNSYGVYTAVIYSNPDTSYPNVNDTITATILISFNAWNGVDSPDAYSLCGVDSDFGCNTQTWQGFEKIFQDGSHSGGLTCNYNSNGVRTLNNSYCPYQLEITQVQGCPSKHVTVTGNFQSVFPTSPIPISSVQVFNTP